MGNPRVLLALLLAGALQRPVWAQTAPVTIWLTLAPGEDPSDAKVQSAQAKIQALLDAPDKQSLPGSLLRYRGAWSPKLDETAKDALEKSLTDDWGKDVRIEVVQDPAEKPSFALPPMTLRAVDVAQKASSLVPAALLSGGQSQVYDGEHSHAAAAEAPSVSAAGASADGLPSAALLSEPPRSGVDLKAIDPSADPCADFYQYACGGWIKSNPIPADQSRWGRFMELRDKSKSDLKEILERDEALKKTADADQKKLGDFYRACMDEKTIDAKGPAALKPDFARIAGLSSLRDLAGEIAREHQEGVDSLFGFGAQQDAADARMMIASIDQGGLSLPDPSYYLDARSADILKAYREHAARMFVLAGDSKKRAADEAAWATAIETALAGVSLDKVSRRDPATVTHKTDLAAFEAQVPSFDWAAYFAAVGAPRFDVLNVASQPYFQGLDEILRSTPLGAWKSYLRWHVLNERASLLSSKLADEHFAFFGRRLSGQKVQQARWKRCASLADGALGDALGRDYVKLHFNAQAKNAALSMIVAIEGAMKDDIRDSAWMSPDTKDKAVAKLEKVTDKIGYPDKWLDYSSLSVSPGDALGNESRAEAFAFRRDLAKIGKPADKGEWGMTPPTINAYYDPANNDINFPAGILQPPFYVAGGDEAVNLGGIGAVMGHELTHGFDDQGHQYDGDGNLKNWWTPQDEKAFAARSQGLVDQYSQFVILKDPKDPSKDVKVDGKLSLGENTADNGGIRLAYAVLQKELAAEPGRKLDGYTPQQRFFLGFGQIWCSEQTEQASRVLAKTDPHSPGRFRTDGVLSNMAEFKQAFSCKDTDAMVNPKPARVW